MNLHGRIPTALLAAALLLVVSSPAVGQTAPPDLTGTWQADTPDGPQTIVVRPDSSASFGEEIIRWRAAPDTVYLALGGEWIGYNFSLRGRTLTLSGGDLVEPIELRRIGPPTPRPEGVPVPPNPDSIPPGSINR